MMWWHYSFRVEGKGDAMITDVIYSNKERAEKQESSSGSKEEYEAMKVCVLLWLTETLLGSRDALGRGGILPLLPPPPFKFVAPPPPKFFFNPLTHLPPRPPFSKCNPLGGFAQLADNGGVQALYSSAQRNINLCEPLGGIYGPCCNDNWEKNFRQL